MARLSVDDELMSINAQPDDRAMILTYARAIAPATSRDLAS
jgi:hypothetical protein